MDNGGRQGTESATLGAVRRVILEMHKQNRGMGYIVLLAVTSYGQRERLAAYLPAICVICAFREGRTYAVRLGLLLRFFSQEVVENQRCGTTRSSCDER